MLHQILIISSPQQDQSGSNVLETGSTPSFFTKKKPSAGEWPWHWESVGALEIDVTVYSVCAGSGNYIIRGFPQMMATSVRAKAVGQMSCWFSCLLRCCGISDTHA